MTIKEFVEKWQPLLTHWSGAMENPQFAEDCRALGFNIDCDKSLARMYPDKNVFQATTLKKIIGEVNDSILLGSAIFARWRYLTHWLDGSPPDDTEEWFTIAFERLKKFGE